MSFYLLKSTYNRKKAGDILIDLDQVESIAAAAKGNLIFLILVTMKSGDYWKASFNTLDDLKICINEILGEKGENLDISDFTPQDE